MALARINEIGTILDIAVSMLFALPVIIVMYATDVNPNEKKYAPTP
jgi:hypothetical protein